MKKAKISTNAKMAVASLAVVAVAGAAFAVSLGAANSSSVMPSGSLVAVSGPKTALVAPHRRPRTLLQRAEHAVVTLYSKKSGSVTVTIDRGKLTSVNSSTIALVHLDGTGVSAAITSSTKFRRATEAQLASELAAGDVVWLETVQSNGTLRTVIQLGKHAVGASAAVATA